MITPDTITKLLVTFSHVNPITLAILLAFMALLTVNVALFSASGNNRTGTGNYYHLSCGIKIDQSSLKYNGKTCLEPPRETLH